MKENENTKTTRVVLLRNKETVKTILINLQTYTWRQPTFINRELALTEFRYA